MSRVELHHGAASDVGLVREINEDSLLAAPPVFVVADGMGGHHGGDVASGIVVDEFGKVDAAGLDSRAAAAMVEETLQACQRRIQEYAESQGGGSSSRWYAGTTAVIGVLVEDAEVPKWLLANVGDSRIYRFDEDALEQVSVDHSMVQELLDAGRITSDEVDTHPDRHVVTRALGGPEQVEPDYFLLPVSAVERLLLCSDGVSGMLAHDRIETILRDAPDPRDAADRLVAAAVEAGGKDNATAVVIDVMGWVADATYDSARTRVSLEEKLGALP